MPVPEMFEDAQNHAQSQQVRGGDPRWYSPNRDFAYVGPALLKQALKGFGDYEAAKASDGPYGQLLRQAGDAASLEQLCDYARLLAHLVMQAGKTDEPMLDMSRRLRAEFASQVGWQAELAVLARLGEMALGCIFAAIRDVTPEGGQPPHQRSIESLVQLAEVMAADYQTKA
jgi:hypothetical protein